MMETGEAMYYGECCEVYKTYESQACTLETNNTYQLKIKRSIIQLMINII